MILIDIFNKTTNLPCSYRGVDFWMDKIEYREDKDEPDKITKTEHIVYATAIEFGREMARAIYTATDFNEALAIYNDIIAAIKHGMTVFHLTVEDVPSENMESAVDNQDNRQPMLRIFTGEALEQFH